MKPRFILKRGDIYDHENVVRVESVVTSEYGGGSLYEKGSDVNQSVG